MEKDTLRPRRTQRDANLRIIPLGGLGEVGRNMTIVEYQGKILIIDMGFRMPEEDMPGVDYIIPNISYLKGKERNILGMLITHGHYDHIGAIPYFISQLGNPPIWAANLAKAIILKRQEDFASQPKLRIAPLQDGKKFALGPFVIEPFRQNHNITDNFGLFIQTPVGNIVHTSDFKFDASPVNEPPTDIKALKRIGDRKILFLMSDSTNAEEPNHSLSEQHIFENLDEIFKQAKGRIITATFASLINRVQQIIALSEKYGRHVALEGYSMKTNVEIAKQLGYIKAKSGTILKTKDVLSYPDSRITICGTGAQGEERAVLMRIVNREHQLVKIQRGDTVIFSSSVIPGNERSVQFVKDQLYKRGANVFHYKMMDIHASGHANQDELREMLELMRPKFLMPVHGQVSMLVNHAKLAQGMGMPEKNILVAENGQIITLSKTQAVIEKSVVPANYIMVDGLGVGDVGEVVLRDRQNLAKDGIFVIIAVVDRQTGTVKGSPDIISRGFIYLRESKDLLREVRKKTMATINHAAGSGGPINWIYMRDVVRNQISEFLFVKTQRRPMVLPVIIEV
ncbi:MAG: RNA-metabolising metallo-beta-lactamase, ribonuclease J [Candidatus Yanofskybacteria bacterium GW2011_GWC1_48_11]|uniref:Ribonuclease J n=1 Tax=Candidatus Yanofskybacteria bacterium GW2011_GWC1_48_11 TaxID=1619027 RepID=A0A837IQI7_9BACT|nr:MAG: RNA-metabolising metallo-beta-lactamase, ribonuclease J [Candidatus Yanofskybacteria bacterium GW2011_GWC1_48_11]